MERSNDAPSRKRKSPPDTAGEDAGKAIKKVANGNSSTLASQTASQGGTKKRSPAKLTDLSNEIFNRRILQFLDTETIKQLLRDNQFRKGFKIDDYFCYDHASPLMDVEGKTFDEVWDEIDDDGLDPDLFWSRLKYRNFGWVEDRYRPQNEPLLDFDPLYRPYLQSLPKCPKCEIHAMELVIKSSAHTKQESRCGRCLERMKGNLPRTKCEGEGCGEHDVCHKCSLKPCILCSKIKCKECIEQCELCKYTKCFDCTTLYSGQDMENDRWVRECYKCRLQVCESCDDKYDVVFFCPECEEGSCTKCKSSLRCHCGCDDVFCLECVTPASCSKCGLTYRRDHADRCSACNGTVS